MKLSDAIVLGSTEFRLDPRFWMCEDGGCLIGLGGYAVGIRYVTDWQQRQGCCDEIKKITNIWPWIDDSFEVPQLLRDLPRYSVNLPYGDADRMTVCPAKGIISSMACHIKEGHMTMEQAIDWIRENEPQEPEVVQPEVKEAEEKIYVAQ